MRDSVISGRCQLYLTKASSKNSLTGTGSYCTDAKYALYSIPSL